MASGRRAVTREFYDSLVIAYRDAPGNASYASRRALCDRRMAKRGWDLGWPQYPWAKPISLVLKEESEAAQAQVRAAHVRAQEDADAQRDLARQESIEARKQEQQMLKAARSDVLAALVLAAELVPSMREIKHIIAEQLAPDPVTGKRPRIPLQLAMGLLTRHATLVQKAVGAAEAVIQLSRLERGASTVNVGVGVPDEELSEDQILEEMEACQQVLERAMKTRALPPAEHDGRLTRTSS